MMTQDSQMEVLADVEQAQDPHRSLHSQTGSYSAWVAGGA